METPKKTSKREKNRNRLKLCVDGQGSGRGLDVGGLVLLGGSLVIAGFVTAFTMRSRRRLRNGSSRNQEDCRDGKGLRLVVMKDQNSHPDAKQEKSRCMGMDMGMPDVDIACKSTFMSNYNLIQANPTHEVRGKMDFDKEVLLPYDPIPDGVTWGVDHQGIVVESSPPAPGFPPLPKEMWNMNKMLSPAGQSIDLSGESKGSDLPHDEQMQGEFLILDDDESPQASDASHCKHMKEGALPIRLILEEDESILGADLLNEEIMEDEESFTHLIVEEEEEEEEEEVAVSSLSPQRSPNDEHMEGGELLAHLVSNEESPQVPKLPYYEHMKEQESLVPSTEEGRDETPKKLHTKQMDAGEMLTLSTEKSKKEEEGDTECDDHGDGSDEIEGYNVEYHEKNSEGTPASSVGSKSEPIWPAESIDETSYELKETTGLSQDDQDNSGNNLSPIKKEVSGEDGIGNGSIDDKRNLKPLPPLLEQIMREAVAVVREIHTLKAKNWLSFIVALFLLTIMLVHHRFGKSHVLNKDDSPSL